MIRKNKKTRTILTYDQYAEVERRGFELPYIFEVLRDGQRLLFYGSEHTNNPRHSQFHDIKQRWEQFIKTSNNPIALVEGRFDEVSQDETKDEVKSIVAGGEAQFVVHLARRDVVAVESPEPDRLWEANELAREFGRDNVVFYYFIRQLGWWNRFTDKPDIRIEAKKMLGLMKKLYNWDDVDFSVARMSTIHKQLFSKPLSWDDTQWIYDITTPVNHNSVTNELARRSGELRDEYIFEEIVNHWNAGRSPFIIFGSAHAIRLEPALRNLGSA